MIRFTEEEATLLRQRAKDHPQVMEQLKKGCEEVFRRPVTIPQTALATWSLYYYCPDHSVQLTFDIDNPYEHRCPVDGKVFTGEPYDGSWWCRRSTMNAAAAVQMADLYLLTGEPCWSDKVIAILEGYAKVYKDYEVHGNIPCNHPGKAFAQAITDADFIRKLATAYDTVSDLL